MNLSKLFEMQRVLDKRITDVHTVQEGENRLAKKILALQVELGECANEWRGFKFWSTDQEPRTRKYLTNYTEQDSHLGVGAVWVNPLLEEYVDCLHFILSIGNEIIKKYGKDLKELVLNDEILIDTSSKKEIDITNQFNMLFLNTTSLYISTIDEYYDYEDSIGIFNELFESFIGLGEMLGFTWNQIEQAYFDKNEVNHNRQATGY